MKVKCKKLYFHFIKKKLEVFVSLKLSVHNWTAATIASVSSKFTTFRRTIFVSLTVLARLNFLTILTVLSFLTFLTFLTLTILTILTLAFLTFLTSISVIGSNSMTRAAWGVSTSPFNFSQYIGEGVEQNVWDQGNCSNYDDQQPKSWWPQFMNVSPVIGSRKIHA